MRITEEAEQDIDNQEDINRKKLAIEIRDRLDTNRDQENISYVHKPEFGVEFQRMKIKDSGFDHRVYFDFVDSELVVFAVRHRDYAYSEADLKEVEERLKDM